MTAEGSLLAFRAPGPRIEARAPFDFSAVMRSLLTPTPLLMWIYCYEMQPCVSCGLKYRSLQLVAPERGVCKACREARVHVR